MRCRPGGKVTRHHASLTANVLTQSALNEKRRLNVMQTVEGGEDTGECETQEQDAFQDDTLNIDWIEFAIGVTFVTGHVARSRRALERNEDTLKLLRD